MGVLGHSFDIGGIFGVFLGHVTLLLADFGPFLGEKSPRPRKIRCVNVGT